MHHIENFFSLLKILETIRKFRYTYQQHNGRWKEAQSRQGCWTVFLFFPSTTSTPSSFLGEIHFAKLFWGVRIKNIIYGRSFPAQKTRTFSKFDTKDPNGLWYQYFFHICRVENQNSQIYHFVLSEELIKDFSYS